MDNSNDHPSTLTQGKPFLRWAGSKRQLLPKLASFWDPSFKRYVEPFMGSACLFFALRPENAILSDLNPDLVRTFRAVRDNPKKLASCLDQLPSGKRAYYRLRQKDPKSLTPIDAAARFIFLNRFCFNGLFRTNLCGQFNVPYAPTATGDLPTVDELTRAAIILKRASLKSGDFESILDSVEKNDFVYLDPPFTVGNRRVFKQYGPHAFGIDDLHRLAKAVKQIDKKGASFVLSYAYCKEALEIFADWPQKKVVVQRNIAGFARCRRTAAEVLISNLLED